MAILEEANIGGVGVGLAHSIEHWLQASQQWGRLQRDGGGRGVARLWGRLGRRVSAQSKQGMPPAWQAPPPCKPAPQREAPSFHTLCAEPLPLLPAHPPAECSVHHAVVQRQLRLHSPGPQV